MRKTLYEKALERYPIKEIKELGILDFHKDERDGYIEGYKQSAKDAYEWLLTHAYTFETPEMVTMFLDMFKQFMSE